MIIRRALWMFLAFAISLFAPLASNAEGPAFKVDPQWPKPLPNNWILGQIGGMTVDAQDNIWVFQRPRSLTDDEKGATLNPPRSKCCVPAPSVLDKRGPLTSSTDLSQFGQAAALAMDAQANEIYAADGYGHHRVAVFDADTGAIKRIWGAYGKPPTDDKLSDYNPESPQFANPVHCVVLAENGLVYVCDRRNNRVQVFHKDGSFVRQYVFDPKTLGSGSAWGVGFSPLDKEQNYFVLLDGTNNEMKTVRVNDGVVVGTSGRPGRQAGEFHWVHAGAFDSRGNIYTGEVDTGKRLQKWVPN